MTEPHISHMRKRIYQLVVPSQTGDPVSRAYDYFIIVIAILSLLPVIFKAGTLPQSLHTVIGYFDVITVYILLLDYLLRWITADLSSRKGGVGSFFRYPFRLVAIIDLLAILPSLGILPSSLMFLRVFRIAKVFRYSRHFRMVGRMLYRQRAALVSVFAMIICYVVLVALIVFSAEPEVFDDFFQAILWSTTILTSTGYGTPIPTSGVALFFSQISTIAGIAVVALPSGIVAGAYIEEMRAAREDEHYFDHSDKYPFEGKFLGEYSSLRNYMQENPRLVRYAKVMVVCCVVNFVLYEVCDLTGAPFWLDTTGTALAAFILEPAAGVIVGFVNNLILAIQGGNASGMLYLTESVVVALAFGLLFKRGERVTPKAILWTLALTILLNSLLQMGLNCLHADNLEGNYTALAMWLSNAGASPLACQYLSILADRATDAVGVLVIFLVARGVMSKRVK